MFFSRFFYILLISEIIIVLYTAKAETEKFCPKTPTISKDYVSYRIQDYAEPFYWTTIYWTKVQDWCADAEGDHYELLKCNKDDCSSDYNSIVQVDAKLSKKDTSFRPQDTWLYVRIRGVNTNGNQSGWSKPYVVDLRKLHPEPYVILFSYIIDRPNDKRFQDNPYGVLVQPDFVNVSGADCYTNIPGVLAKEPWPALFDYECCNSAGIMVFPAAPDALHFQLTDEILKLKDTRDINGRYWVAFDWVSVYHFTVIKIGDRYCICKVDDSELIQTGDAKKSVLIYCNTNRIYQLLYNPLGSLLFWTEDTNITDTFIEIKVKFKDNREQSLVKKCFCINGLNVTSSSVELDWRQFYTENGTGQPGVLFIANESLWRANSVLNQCTCEKLIDNVMNLTGADSGFVQISADWSYFYWLNRHSHLMSYNWKTGAVQTLWNDSKISQLGHITQFRVAGPEHRPFSPTYCYFPLFENVTARMTSKSEAVVSLILNWNNSEVCINIPKPPLDFAIRYALVENRTDLDNLSCEVLECKTIKFTWSREITSKQVPLKHLLFNKTYYLYATVSPGDQYPTPYKPYSQEADFDIQLFNTFYIPLYVRKHTPIRRVIVGSGILLLVLLVVLVCSLAANCMKYRQFKDIPKVWRSELIIRAKISEGHFGEVYSGKWKTKNKKVAIKTLKQTAGDYEERCFLEEIHITWRAKNPYVVELLAVCLTAGRYRMVLEFIEGVALIKHLKDLKATKYSDAVCSSKLDIEDEKDLTKTMLCIAKACVHLESLQILHRDLAARNVMTIKYPKSEKIEKAKLIDFGLAKQIDKSEKVENAELKGVYKARPDRVNPIHLLSPETYTKDVFTPKTEVWGFGMLLWETFSLGDIPYKHMTVMEISEFLAGGNRLTRPHYCSPDELYILIKWCWKTEPEQRPDFKIIQKKIENIAKFSFKQTAGETLANSETRLPCMRPVYVRVLSQTRKPAVRLSAAYAETKIENKEIQNVGDVAARSLPIEPDQKISEL